MRIVQEVPANAPSPLAVLGWSQIQTVLSGGERYVVVQGPLQRDSFQDGPDGIIAVQGESSGLRRHQEVHAPVKAFSQAVDDCLSHERKERPLFSGRALGGIPWVGGGVLSLDLHGLALLLLAYLAVIGQELRQHLPIGLDLLNPVSVAACSPQSSTTVRSEGKSVLFVDLDDPGKMLQHLMQRGTL